MTQDIGDEHPRRSRLWRRWGHQVTTSVLAVILVIVLVIYRKPVGELRLDPWVAAVFLAMVFHQPIVNRIKNMKSVSTPAGSMQFEAEAREVAQDAAEEQQSSSQGLQQVGTDSIRARRDLWDVRDEAEWPAHGEPAPETVDRALRVTALQAARREINLRNEFSFYYRLATRRPRVAVVQVRQHLDSLAVWAFNEAGLEIDVPRVKVLTQLDQLIPLGFSPDIVGTALEVRVLGNRAVNDQTIELTAAAAVNYVNAAEQMAIALLRFISAMQAD